VKHLRHIFRCPLCCTNKHNFSQCPILTCTFSITKLVVDDKKGSVSSVATDEIVSSPHFGENLGQAASVTLPLVESPLSSSNDSVMDASVEEDKIDHLGIIDLDIVDNFSSVAL
jgi:hypothetical protein